MTIAEKYARKIRIELKGEWDEFAQKHLESIVGLAINEALLEDAAIPDLPKMMYEIQTHTVMEGWVNPSVTDHGEPERYANEHEAKSELIRHMWNMQEAFDDGLMDDRPDPDDWRVQAVIP